MQKKTHIGHLLNRAQVNLPHWHPRGAEFFVTFRLAKSLPKHVIEKPKVEQKVCLTSNQNHTDGRRKLFRKYEHYLDGSKYGPKWLSKTVIADLVAKSIHYRDKNVYDLYCFCIMPNHVHLVCKLNEATGINNKQNTDTTINQPAPLTKVLKELKRYTAREANKVLGLSGQFWQHESYDRVIRGNNENTDFPLLMKEGSGVVGSKGYILPPKHFNPVKAEFVKFWGRMALFLL